MSISSPTSVGDNAFAPGSSGYSYSPDRLLITGFDIQIDNIVLASGAGALKRGTVLGRITLGAVTSAAKSGGNTGNGTCTPDATAPKQANAIAGIYTLRCITAAANNGTFRLTDPRGRVLGDYIMAAGAVTITNQIKVAIADGATDFIVGDGFDVTIADGSTKFVKAVKTALDGSATPVRVLVDDADATSADCAAAGYREAGLVAGRLVIDASYTLAEIKTLLRDSGLVLKDALSAADPT